MKSIFLFLPFFFCASILGQVEFQICIPNSWAGGGSGEITITNVSGSPIGGGSTLELNWTGITSVSPFWGMSVSGNGPYTFTFTDPIPAGGSIGPIGFNFTNSGAYFTPSTGIFNNSSTVNTEIPQCYVPPSYQNFDCETSISEYCLTPTPNEILIGEGTLHSWNATLDAYIPTNKKNWAIGMAFAHTLFNNLVGFDAMSINQNFATALQETNCGCDGTITAPGWVSNPYPDWETTNPVYCFDYTHGVAVGFFQEEHGTGWLELEQDIPCFIPNINFDQAIVGKNYAAQLVGKTYHDYNNIAFLQYIQCFDILDFMENCTDPYGSEKLLAAIYNRGMNAGFIQDILVTNRASAITASDLLPFIGGLGETYAEQISRNTAVLDNQTGLVSTYGTSSQGITWPGVHNHNGFYDSPITWTDIDIFLDSIDVIYSTVGVNMNTIKGIAQSTFNNINGGAPISFRYELGPVIDSIVVNLPSYDPMPGLGSIYGNSGGNSCTFPTASMQGDTVNCNGGQAYLTVYLTGSAPWSITYEYGGNSTTVNNIMSSPYSIPISSAGEYYLTSVTDNTGTIGEADCHPSIISIGGANAPQIQIATPSVIDCNNTSLQLDASGSTGNGITFNWNTGNGNLVSGNNTATPTVDQGGTYTLTVNDINGCSNSASVMVNMDTISPTVIIAPGDTINCANTTINLDATGSSAGNFQWNTQNGNIVSGANGPTPTINVAGQYELTLLGNNGCTGMGSIIIIADTTSPIVDINTPDTINCITSTVILNASNSDVGNYNWGSNTGQILTGGSTLTPTVNEPGFYWLNITSSNGCEGADSVEVISDTVAPIIQFSPLDTIHCLNSSVLIDASNSIGNQLSYFWSTTNGNISGASNTASITVLSNGDYELTLIDDNGCVSIQSVNIFESPMPIAQFIPTPDSGLVPLSVSFSDYSNGSGLSYSWNFGDGVSSTDSNPNHLFEAIGEYIIELTVTDEFGCTHMATYTINVFGESTLTVPNVFTPNGDGINDRFDASGINIGSFKGAIYNRWGQKLYNWEELTQGWDGRTYSGSEVPAGTYFYVIEATGLDHQQYQLEGTLQLNR